MLTYLNGPRRPIFKKAAPKPAPAAKPANLKKSGVIKKLLKASPPALVIKAVKRAPMVRAQVKQFRALQPIQQKSPLTASRIKKAAIEKHRRQTFQAQSEPLMLEPAIQEQEAPTPQTEQEVEQVFNEIESQEPEAQEFFESEDAEPESQEPEDLGIYYPGMGKLFKKKAATAPKQTKAQKKAQKPRQVRKTITAESKAAARKDRAARPKGEVLKKLIDTGGKILDKTLNKGGTEADLQVPEVREAGAFSLQSIPAPVKYIGLAALAYLGYKALKPKN